MRLNGKKLMKRVLINNIKELVWDNKKQSIRGSFVNLLLTINIFALFWVGVLVDGLSERIAEMGTLIAGVYLTSIGAWSYRKIKEQNQGE